jgi:L-2-hydroxyglutarate oxidase LhgO
MMDRIETVVIGAGVVGLAIARELARRGREVVVLDRATTIGAEASSHNSEVIHAGIHYPAGSLKERLCVAGRDLLYAYCRSRGIAHREVGKLLVATSSDETRVLEKYRDQARSNGAGELEPMTRAEVQALEPEVYCVAGLRSPRTGIIDSHAYMLALQRDLEDAGGHVVLRTAVERGVCRREGLMIEVSGASPDSICAREVVLAAGCESPQVARRMAGLPAGSIPACHYAKGHYFRYAGRPPFGRLVYPVADAGSLGIHVTLDLAGQVRFGPDVEWIAAPDYRFDERRRDRFAAAIRRYYPGLDVHRLEPAYTGIRAKIVGPGASPGDFLAVGPHVHGVSGFVALYGIESPGLTASLALAHHVAKMLD